MHGEYKNSDITSDNMILNDNILNETYDKCIKRNEGGYHFPNRDKESLVQN